MINSHAKATNSAVAFKCYNY